MATAEDKRLMAAMAGTNVAFWRMNSELSKLFDKAMDNDYTPDRLLAEAKNTRWYKNHAESVRKIQALRKQEPAEYRRRLAASQAEVRKFIRTAGFGKDWNSKYWGRLALVNQWSEEELRYKMGRYIKGRYQKGNIFGGELGQTLQRARQSARNNGVRLSKGFMGTQLQNIAKGVSTEEALMERIRRKAISAFPGLADEIKGGMSVREFADDYISTYSELMEMNSADVDLFNRDIRDALNAKGKDGKRSPLSIGDFEDRVRSTKKWLRTGNAQDSMMEANHAVLQAFGVTW